MMLLKPTSISISSQLIISLLLILLPSHAFAQSKKVMVEQPDTIPFFRSVAVSFDLVGAGMLAFSDYGQYEGAVRVNLKDKYFPIVELGLGKADADNVNSRMHYQTSAPYIRAGVDFNVMKNKHDDYRIYVGARYAFTSFKFDVDNDGVSDPVWGDKVDFNFVDNKASYHWLEFAAGIDAKIWKLFRLGWSVRYRRRLFHSDPDLGEPWYVPGFGKSGGSRIGGTFNVIFEF